MPFIRKVQTTIDEAEPIGSPARRLRTNQANGSLKDNTLKFHNELVRGINIARSMGLNNEKYTPLFSYYLFKTVSDKLKKFRDEELMNVQSMETSN